MVLRKHHGGIFWRERWGGRHRGRAKVRGNQRRNRAIDLLRRRLRGGAPAAGSNVYKILQQKRAPKVDLPKTIDVTVARAVNLGQGLYRLTIDNEQVWETKEAYWNLEFKSSDMITISRLPLGGYQISMAGKGRSVAARRIQ